MPFTDDRLRILKNIELKQTAPISISHTDMEALITRLEAAESALGTDCYANGDCTLCKVHHERYLAWRAAAGKS